MTQRSLKQCNLNIGKTFILSLDFFSSVSTCQASINNEKRLFINDRVAQNCLTKDNFETVKDRQILVF